MPYIQTRVVTVLPIHRIGYVEAYRTLREHNHFGVLESVRLALWLAYGNEAFPPGELRSWLKRQYAEHPKAFGFCMVLWADALLIFFYWLATR